MKRYWLTHFLSKYERKNVKKYARKVTGTEVFYTSPRVKRNITPGSYHRAIKYKRTELIFIGAAKQVQKANQFDLYNVL
jgi:hypothetical protein